MGSVYYAQDILWATYFNLGCISTWKIQWNFGSTFYGVASVRIVTLRMNFQEAFTCSKWTIETLEKGVKYVQSQQ